MISLNVTSLLGDEGAEANRCASMWVRLHLCSCGYPSFCVKRIASGPLTTHQVSAQSIQPFPRYEKRCACAHVHLHPTITFSKVTSYWVSNYKPDFSQSVQPFPRCGKGGASARAHVQMYPTCAICIAA